MSLARATVVTALLAGVCVSANAQGVVVGGPYAPVVLFTPGNARTLALGNTGVASRDDPLFFNPAMLVLARGATISGERFSASASGGAFSSFTQFATGAIGVGARLVSYDAPSSSFPSSRLTFLDGGAAGGTSVEAVAGIGQVVKGLRVGIAAKYAQENVPAKRAGRAAIDVGVSKDVFRIYTIGLAIQNIGQSMSVACDIASQGCAPLSAPGGGSLADLSTDAHLPLRTTLGVAAARGVGEFDVSGTAALSLLRTDFLIPSGGAEISYSWLDGYAIALRAGGRRPLPGEGGLTAGVGFNVDRLAIDYGLETLTHSRIGHRIGLRIR